MTQQERQQDTVESENELEHHSLPSLNQESSNDVSEDSSPDSAAWRRLLYVALAVVPTSLGAHYLSVRQERQKIEEAAEVFSNMNMPAAVLSADDSPEKKISQWRQGLNEFREEHKSWDSFKNIDEVEAAIQKGYLVKRVTEIFKQNGLFDYVFYIQGETSKAPRRGGQGSQNRRLNIVHKESEIRLRGIAKGEERQKLLSLIDGKDFKFRSEDEKLITGERESRSYLGTAASFAAAAALVTLVILTLRRGRKDKGANNLLDNSDIKERQPYRPNKGFNTLGGIEHIIDDLHDLKTKITHYKKGIAGINIPRGFILKGPTGSGKTAAVNALAAETDCHVLFVPLASNTKLLVGSGTTRLKDSLKVGLDWLTKTRERISAGKWKKGVKKEVLIVLFDEAEAVLKKRNPLETNADERENQLRLLLSILDGPEAHIYSDIIFAATTNQGEILDDAVKDRPGRFELVLQVDYPVSLTDRYDVLEKRMKQDLTPHGFSIDSKNSLQHLASITPGFSPDKLRQILVNAKNLAIDEEREVVTNLDLFEAFNRVVPGGGRIKRKHTVPQNYVEQVLVHEIGHGFGGYIIANSPFRDRLGLEKNDPATLLVSGKPRGNTLGRVIVNPKLMGEILRTERQLLARIAILISGPAAEDAIYSRSDSSDGLVMDLKEAQRITTHMLSNGMLEGFYHINIQSLPPEFVVDQLRDSINTLLRQSRKLGQDWSNTIGRERVLDAAKKIMSADKEFVVPESDAIFDEMFNDDEGQQKFKKCQELLEKYFEDPFGDGRTSKGFEELIDDDLQKQVDPRQIYSSGQDAAG